MSTHPDIEKARDAIYELHSLACEEGGQAFELPPVALAALEGLSALERGFGFDGVGEPRCEHGLRKEQRCWLCGCRAHREEMAALRGANRAKFGGSAE